MTFTFLRNALLGTLAAASLASCGGTATFEIAGTVVNQLYPGLVLVETVSNQTITLNDVTKKTFVFPNTIDYGTPYNVIVRVTPSGNPPHQTCELTGGNPSDTAGRQASIQMTVGCGLTQHTVAGSIKMATGSTGSYVGLQLINGSNSASPITISAATTSVYTFGGVVYMQPYGISILTQPTDQTVKCKLKPKIAAPTDTDLKVSGIMGDVDVVVDIECAKVP